MGASSASACALIAIVSQMAGCAASSRNAGAESSRTDTVPPKIEASAEPHELRSQSTSAETCAIGWTQIQKEVCVRFSKLEQSDDLRSDLVAMDLVSKTSYVHLNLRVAVFRGAQKWCAYPGVLSLYQIEANHEYAFRIPCSTSGTRIASGELRLVVDVDEAIEMHPPR